MKKRLFKIVLGAAMCIIFVACAAVTSSAQETKRVKFAKGKSAATVKGAVLRDELITYVVNAAKGQRMNVVITSVEKNASFWIETPDGGYLPGAGEEDDQTKWNGVLPAAGDYKIAVAPTRGNATYRMTITIK